MSAGATTKAQKAPRQNAAVKKGTELLLDESRDWAVTLLLRSEESFEFCDDNTVENSCFGIARSVFKPAVLHAQWRYAGIKPVL